MPAKTKPASPEDAIDPSKALVPVVHKANEMRVKRDFWPKLRKVASRIPFAGDALAAWYASQDPETPFRARAVMFGALAYFVMPVDAIPDFLTVVGFTDDAAVFAALLATMGANIKPRHHAKARETLSKIAGDPQAEAGD